MNNDTDVDMLFISNLSAMHNIFNDLSFGLVSLKNSIPVELGSGLLSYQLKIKSTVDQWQGQLWVQLFFNCLQDTKLIKTWQ